MPKYKLYYFNLRCRGEPVRLLFAYNNVQYEDFRISEADWPKYKPKMPMGQVPVLEIDDTKMLCQAKAISRYLAKQFGLVGKDDWEMAQADMLVDGIWDMWLNLRDAFLPLYDNDPEKFKVEWQKFKTNHLPLFLANYQKLLDANKSNWFVGNNITWADLVVSEFLGVLQEKFSPDALDGHPSLKEYVDRVHSLPQLKEYIKNRPNVLY